MQSSRKRLPVETERIVREADTEGYLRGSKGLTERVEKETRQPEPNIEGYLNRICS